MGRSKDSVFGQQIFTSILSKSSFALGDCCFAYVQNVEKVVCVVVHVETEAIFAGERTEKHPPLNSLFPEFIAAVDPFLPKLLLKCI